MYDVYLDFFEVLADSLAAAAVPFLFSFMLLLLMLLMSGPARFSFLSIIPSSAMTMNRR